MKPEELKVIAYAIGKMNVHIRHEEVLHELPTCEPHPRCIVTYNPLTNNDQMVEIMERLKVAVQWSRTDSCWISEILFLPENSDAIIYDNEGKTINEAVCNTAYEYFKCQ